MISYPSSLLIDASSRRIQNNMSFPSVLRFVAAIASATFPLPERRISFIADALRSAGTSAETTGNSESGVRQPHNPVRFEKI